MGALKAAALVLSLLLLCGWSHGRGPETFYVSNSGNDSNNGLTPTTAWATPGKVNSSSFNSGDTVAFDGGSTFSAGLTLTQTNAPSNLTLTSFNAGQPTFNIGTGLNCITATNFPSLTINNLNCVGAGDSSNDSWGMKISNLFTGSGNTLEGPIIKNNTISGFGHSCLWVNGAGSGFANIVITGNTTHDCTGGGTLALGGGLACIFISGTPLSTTIMSRPTVTSNTVFNCPGTAGLSDQSGTGIGVQTSNHALVSANLVHDTGANGTFGGVGPVGIILFNVDASIMSFNEVYNTHGGTSHADGEALNYGSSTNSIMEYNYAHGTADSFYILMDDGSAANTGNAIRFNVVEVTSSVPGLHYSINSSSDLTQSVYNNTFYLSGGGGINGACAGGGTATAFTFSNNIFYSLSQQPYNIGNSGGSTCSFTITGNDYFFSTGTFSVTINGTAYTSLANFQAACSSPSSVFEKTGVCVTAVGTTSNPNLMGTVGAGGNCLAMFTTPCPTAYELTSSSPAGKGNGQNLNSLYSFNVGTQDIYGNVITNTTLPIGAAANK